jgi:DNA-binding response OmpR family regulator
MLPLLLIITSSRLADSLRHEIGAAGFKAHGVESLAAARAVLAQWRFDAVVLHGAGFGAAVPEMLASLRRDRTVPILLVADDADEDRQLRALEAGASQIVVAATSARVLAAQLQRLIDVAQPRRPAPEVSAVRYGPLRLDPRRAAASVDDTPVTLTGGEFEVLLLLASRPGELVDRQTIARTLGRAVRVETRRSADMHVCRIRKKLREAGGASLQIQTLYGRGYLLRLRPEPSARDALRVAEWSL